jgi:hypothetical protein
MLDRVPGDAISMSDLPLLLPALLRNDGPWPLVFFAPFWCCGCVVGLGLLVLWIWTIVDCATREPKEGNERLIWILIIVLTGWIGSLIYVFVRRPQRVRELGR